MQLTLRKFPPKRMSGFHTLVIDAIGSECPNERDEERKAPYGIVTSGVCVALAGLLAPCTRVPLAAEECMQLE